MALVNQNAQREPSRASNRRYVDRWRLGDPSVGANGLGFRANVLTCSPPLAESSLAKSSSGHHRPSEQSTDGLDDGPFE